jgi:hypothetical protein
VISLGTKAARHPDPAYRDGVIARLQQGGADALWAGIRSDLNGVDPTRYHETLTRAWILAVRHFMNKTRGGKSADELIAKNPEMLDSRSMLTHYSSEVLFSDEARQAFVQPDLDPIPRHAG